MGDLSGSPLAVCMRCGCSRIGGSGLQAPCRWTHPRARRRLDLIGDGLHPYSKLPIALGRAGLVELESEHGSSDLVGLSGIGSEGFWW
jgi:hypothetical protein